MYQRDHVNTKDETSMKIVRSLYCLSPSIYYSQRQFLNSVNYIDRQLDVSYIGRQVYGELIYQIRIWFLHYTIRFVLSQNFFLIVCLCLGLSTLVHQGHHLLDPSADLHPSDQRRNPSYRNIKPLLSKIIHI